MDDPPWIKQHKRMIRRSRVRTNPSGTDLDSRGTKIPKMEGAGLGDGIPGKLPALDKGDGSTLGDAGSEPTATA
jgi:hypothetical protein